MIFRFCQIVPDKISDKFTEGIFCIRSSIRVALNGNPLGAKKTPLGRMKVNDVSTTQYKWLDKSVKPLSSYTH